MSLVLYADAPLASFQGLASMAALYLVIRFGGEAAMKNREAMNFKFVAMVSNAILTLGSLWMFLGIGYHLVINFAANDWNPNLLICDPELKLQQGMDLYIYAFYLSKFWEYIDTILLILNKKEVIYLHWFHHFITPSICWAAWHYPYASAWMGPITNAGVHVIMYAYYTMTYFGLSRWVGKYITKLQIVQFVFNLGIFTAIFTNYIFWQGHDKCGGHAPAQVYCYANYLYFLFLFIRFNQARLRRLAEPKKAAAAAQNGTNGVAKKTE
eukprot:comp24818_c0_seq1/m.46890 comp24818_c0_seq1/g.46890  ORF comp24818_c0_seq1/g.46890 comp24818_c0_seq1/m.46890 type:complete len:268 (-) comp24818_c0_seq1:534-1337(-)